MTRKTRPYREALLEALADPLEAAEYLTAAHRDSPEMFRKACLNVIQARQVAKIAREVGVARESLYRSFSVSGNPSQETVESVLAALDLKFSGIEPISESPTAAPLGGSLGQRTKPRFTQRGGRKRRKRSTPSAKLSTNYQLDLFTQGRTAVLARTTVTTVAGIGAQVGSKKTDQGDSGTFRMPEIKRFSGSYPGLYSAQNQRGALYQSIGNEMVG